MTFKYPKLTLLAGALMLGLGGAVQAQEPPVDPPTPPVNPTPPVDPVDPIAPPPVDPIDATTEANVQGETVSEFARERARQRQMTPPPPDSPPGSDISQVAHGQRDFMHLDADKDGLIAEAEVEAGSELELEFETYDSNGDGELSRTEFDAYVLASVEADDEDEESE